MVPEGSESQGQSLVTAGWVLSLAALPVPTSAIAALVVGTIAIVRGQVVSGAAIIWVAALLGIAGGLLWYELLDLEDVLFFPDPPDYVIQGR
jgi:hypothetical protein